ncbi:MAG: DMT family transporter [Prevotellaceae bacterium]|nr:DMT family transporter [Prevotellaceae bacterium]
MLKMRLTRPSLAMVLAIFVCFIWGETFVSSKVLLSNGLLPSDIFFMRFIIAYVCLLTVSHKCLWAQSFRDEILLLLLGIAGGSLYFLSENMALEYSTASNVSIIVGTTPMSTALLLACFYEEERMSKVQILGSLIAFVGLVLVVLNGQLILHLNPLGDTLAICASLTWAVYSLIIKRLSAGYDAMFITRKVFAYGLITILPWLIFVNPLQTDMKVLLQPVVWGNLVYLGVVASMLCFVLWNWILPRLGVVKATNVVYTQSIFTMAISAVVLHERITLMAIIGALILIAGMVLITIKRGR